MLSCKIIVSNLSICFWTVKRKLHDQSLYFTGTKGYLEGNALEESSRHPDLLIFDLGCIVAATDNFSPINKLGQGGFGSVFKVQLQFIMTSFNVEILYIFLSFSNSIIVWVWMQENDLHKLRHKLLKNQMVALNSIALK